MRISVIVPCYNSEATLDQCLSAIRRSSFRDFELVVANDGSTDRTREIALGKADRVIDSVENLGAGRARWRAARECRGELLIFVDSDVLVQEDTIEKVAAFFASNPGVDGLTGRLSKIHPHENFASQYKNLYMNYVFGRLPSRVTFLYGSIFGLKREVLEMAGEFDNRFAEDTALGQRLHSLGRELAFLPELEVVHLKRYSLRSLVRNDFFVPFDWAGIFVRSGGLRQLGRSGTGFAHASRSQLASVILAPLGLLAAAWALVGSSCALIALSLAWLALNLPFLGFLARERGLLFGLSSALYTYLDHLIMASGIAVGFAGALLRRSATSKA